jgi:hypothetical protein
MLSLKHSLSGSIAVCAVLALFPACGGSESPSGGVQTGGSSGSGSGGTTGTGSGGSSGQGGSGVAGQTGQGGKAGDGGSGQGGRTGGAGGAGGGQDAAVDGNRDVANDLLTTMDARADGTTDAQCPAIKCAVACPFGYLADARGCQTCTCKPVDCRPTDCGGPPPMVGICPTGSSRVLVCERNPSGVCGWYSACEPVTTSCAAPTRERCALRSNCRWLAPGCSTPALEKAGCYATAEVGCTPTSCPSGKTCVTRTINPCGSAPASAADPMTRPAFPVPPGPPTTCAACAQQIAVCQ